MLLTRSRIPILALGLIALFAFVLLLNARTASSDTAAGDIPGGTFDTLPATDIFWTWTQAGAGADVNVCIVLGDTWINAAMAAHDIEVFLDPVLGTDAATVGVGPTDLGALYEGPVLAATTGLADNTFAINTLTCFPDAGLLGVNNGNLVAQAFAVTNVGLHILDVTHTLIGTSNGATTDDAALHVIPAALGWNWTGQIDQLKIVVDIDPAMAPIHKIDVFVNNVLAFSQSPTAGGAFPTGVDFGFIGTVANLAAPLTDGVTPVKLHFVGADGVTDVVRSANPANIGLVDVINTPASAPPSEDGGGGVIAGPLPTAIPEASPTPPPTGGLAPGSGLLLPMLLVGFLMILAGGVYLARDRRLRS